MTCAHVVHVALKNVSGVETVDVSLNKGLATVRLKPGNTISVPQLWEVIHKNGYTPKATTVTARGNLVATNGRLDLKVAGTKDTLLLAADANNASLYRDAFKRAGQSVIVDGVMLPGKDLKQPVPLTLAKIK